MGEESQDKQGELMKMGRPVCSVYHLHIPYKVGWKKSSIEKTLFQKEIAKMGEFFFKEDGAAAMEYALLLSLIGMIVIGSVQALGSNVFDGLSALDHVFVSTQFKDDLLHTHK